MILYEDARAPNPRRVRVFLAEKGIDVPRQEVDIMVSAHKTDEMLALNRFERVPFLVLDDGQVISETVAICRYFEERHPEPALFGTGALERAQVEMWQRRIEFELFGSIAHAFRHSNPYMAELENPQVDEWSKVNFGRVEVALDRIDAEIAEREFIAGDQYSIADITCLVAVDFMRIIKKRLDDKHPNLLAWYQKVSTRPGSVK
jgi:glutathione S-transferase